MKNVSLSVLLLGLVALGLNGLGTAQSATPRRSVNPAEVVNIVLHDAQPTYTVPIGKVLTIENFIWALESSSTHQFIGITPGNDPAGVGSFILKFDTDNPDMFTPGKPIRIIGDGAAGVEVLYTSAGANWRDVAILGYLQDV